MTAVIPSQRTLATFRVLALVSGFCGVFAFLAAAAGAPSATVVTLCAISLVLAVAHVYRRFADSAAILGFLPAVLFSLAIRWADYPSGTMAMAAATFALQARLWLLDLASVRRRERAGYDATGRLAETSEAAVFIDNDIESRVPLTSLHEGHLVRVAAGQLVPADATVTFGSGFVDEGLAGREDLRLVGMGSSIYAGSRNRNGSLLAKVTASGANTFAARLTRSFARESRAGFRWIPELASLCAAMGLFALGGAESAFPALLTVSFVGVLGALEAFDFSVARAARTHRWLWGGDAGARLARSGMLVTTATGVLTEGRPKLVAIETCGPLSEDAALGLLGPLARKLETPAGFAVLLELRSRNIPLQPADFFEPQPGGGLVVLAGEELRWITLDGARRESTVLGALEPFVREHENVGDELCVLERQGTVQAAFAFRDSLLPGAKNAIEELRRAGVPTLLVSSATKRCAARQQSELGLEHAQGECGERETDALVARLAAEGLAPAWMQMGPYRPARAFATIALPGAAADADLFLPDLSLERASLAVRFARLAHSRLRLAFGFLFSWQLGLLFALLGADPVLARALHLGGGWAVSPLAVAFAGVLPAYVAFFLAHSRADE